MRCQGSHRVRPIRAGQYAEPRRRTRPTCGSRQGPARTRVRSSTRSPASGASGGCLWAGCRKVMHSAARASPISGSRDTARPAGDPAIRFAAAHGSGNARLAPRSQFPDRLMAHVRTACATASRSAFDVPSTFNAAAAVARQVGVQPDPSVRGLIIARDRIPKAGHLPTRPV